MIKAGDNERFYKDVEGLGLKFPVAAIAKATGYSKGNVSQYLSKKLPPSESFLNAFYDAFKESIKKVSHETPEVSSNNNLTEAILSITRSNEGLVRANTVIAEANLKLAEKVSASESEEIPLAVESRFSDLLELIAELGTGTRWKSKQEALAVLSKLWHGKKRGVSRAGIRND
jgi:transcriptional regulator with XRE-family HTH domain